MLWEGRQIGPHAYIFGGGNISCDVIDFLACSRDTYLDREYDGICVQR